MVHITESFLKEVELLKLINKSHRAMHWEIVPKELKYSDCGDELYANSYELILTDDRFGQEKRRLMFRNLAEMITMSAA